MNTKDIKRCNIPNCPVCKLARARRVRTAPNKYLPRKISVARGQMKLFEAAKGQ